MHGKDIYRQELAVKNILKKNNIADDRVRTIDASDRKTFRIEEVLLACDSFSLFGGEGMKAVIVDRPYYLNASVKYAEAVKKTDTAAVRSRKEKDLKDREYRLDLLKQYLAAPNPETILIFFCRDYTADSRKKDYKLLKEMNVTIIEEKKLTRQDFQKFTADRLRENGLTLTENAWKELLVRVDQDTMRVKNAVETLVLYGEGRLNSEDIRHLVPMPQDVQMYALGEAFLKGNIREMQRIRKELSVRNISVSTMVSSLGGSVRRAFHIRRMYEEGYDIGIIASRLGVQEWIVQYTLRDVQASSGRLLRYMNELADLDQGIKSGRITDPDSALDLWIIASGGKRAYGAG